MALLPSSSCCSSSSSNGGKYDVFLSFRGEDTRKRFTDHLYRALKQQGIFTFKDDEKLKQGTSIAPELLKAIEESRFAVIILSGDYASSKWCLIELTKIIECMEKTGLVVLPVFHYVDPSDVRNHRGTFAEAFDRHEESFKDNMGKVETWKAALTKVANLSGWDLKDRYESEVIQEIIGRICTELDHKFPRVYEALVGMDSRVEEMLGSYLGEGLGDVLFVGICGMGGMGKTTLAREIFRRISSKFVASSFIANVREETKNQGLVFLQKQLLSKILVERKINIWDVYDGIDAIRRRLCNKKVFIVLDDVDEERQFEALAGNHDWFGAGSRIVLTSRDSHFLKRNGVDYIYTIEGLNDDKALELFSWGAFKKTHPEESYMDLSMDFVNYAKGLPLALKVLGPLLFGKTMGEWKSALNYLKAVVGEKIMPILQISFDGLMDMQKELFLDIACFFKGEKRDCISDILESFGYYPGYNIGVLEDKSLITIDDDGILLMHDLLQDMGQEIVRRESPTELGGRSRLWIYDDVIHVLKNNSGTEAVKGIMVNIPIQKVEYLSAETFSKMKNLRLLKISSEKLPEDSINGTMQLPKDLSRGKVQLPQGLSYLSHELRLLEWHGYHLKCLPTNFQLNKIVELRMHCSGIKRLWNGNMNLGELRLIDLSDSQNLIEIPDLSGAPKLKQLIFRHCTRLYKIHASIEDLKQLIRLDLNGCKRLGSLPHKISLEALEILDLGGCSKLDELPENLGNIEGLKKLDVSETAITRLPLSVSHLKNLEVLSLRGCVGLLSESFNKLLSFPLMQQGLWSLMELDLSYCNIRTVPDVFGSLPSLKDLYLNGNNFVCLPKSIIQLSNLRCLSLNGCTRLQMLPKLPLNMYSIREDGCTFSAKGCTSLETLSLLDPEGDSWPNISLLNCVNLIYNQGKGDLLSTILRHHIIKRCCECIPTMDPFFTIPGSEIPNWFRHQNVGASVNLQVPSHLFFNSKFLEIAVCAVYIIRQPHPLHRTSFAPYNDDYCFVKVNGVTYCTRRFRCDSRSVTESHHLWLRYFSFQFFSSDRYKLDANEFTKIEVTFETRGPGSEVTKCGAHLICEQNIEDLKQTEPGSSSCTITPYYEDDDLGDSEKDTKIKESRDDEPPQPKWTEHPNLIENWIGNSCIQGQGDSDCE